MIAAGFVIALLSGQALLALADDFERGSGGIRLPALESAGQLAIFALMCLFTAWVLYASLRDCIDANSDTYFTIFSRIARSLVLCVVVILTLT